MTKAKSKPKTTKAPKPSKAKVAKPARDTKPGRGRAPLGAHLTKVLRRPKAGTPPSEPAGAPTGPGPRGRRWPWSRSPKAVGPAAPGPELAPAPARPGRRTTVEVEGRPRFRFGRKGKAGEAPAPAAAAPPEPAAKPVRAAIEEHGVLLRWRRTNSANGSARYSQALAAALRQSGTDVKESHPFYRELRLGRLRLGGRMSLALGSRLPRWSRRVVHATQVYDNPPWRAADVVTVHDVMPITRPELYGLRRGGVRKWRRKVRRALRKGHVVTPSEHSRREILEAFPKDADPARITVVPHGIDHAAFRPGEPARWVRNVVRTGFLNVAIVMNAELRKRIDVVAEAAAASPYVNLVHVGTTVAPKRHRANLAKADSALRHMAKQGRYKALGAIPDAALRDLLASADLVVHASEAEGFGLPPLEALACGAAVLASDIPAHREVLGDAVRYFALDARALADEFDLAWTGVTPTLEHFPPVDARLRQAELFTWPRAAEKHLAVYGHVQK
jgi:glycosyltransferase involved in cell wall biosynthesis